MATLNGAAKIERLRAQVAERLREFVPALFERMFGDPARNPLGWQTACLGDVCDAQGGLQVTKKRAARLWKYLICASRTYCVTSLFLGDQVHEGD